MKFLKTAVVQMTSSDVVEHNIEQIFAALEQAKGADIISFPENCLFLRIDMKQAPFAIAADAPVFARLESWSKANNALIHLGSLPLSEQGKMFNTTVVVTPEQGCQRVYRKMHLFDIDLEGRAPLRESDHYAHGDVPSFSDWQSFRLAWSICYDLRFAEMYGVYAKNRADVIFVPAAFLPETGQAHWEVLLRARAIESQCYVVAAAQAGEHKSTTGQIRTTHGHSLVVDPWGKVVGEAADGPAVITANVEREVIERVRRQIPMHKHRRMWA